MQIIISVVSADLSIALLQPTFVMLILPTERPISKLASHGETTPLLD